MTHRAQPREAEQDRTGFISSWKRSQCGSVNVSRSQPRFVFTMSDTLGRIHRQRKLILIFQAFHQKPHTRGVCAHRAITLQKKNIRAIHKVKYVRLENQNQIKNFLKLQAFSHCKPACRSISAISLPGVLVIQSLSHFISTAGGVHYCNCRSRSRTCLLYFFLRCTIVLKASEIPP